MLCKLQSTLHITAMAVLESVLQWHVFDRGLVIHTLQNKCQYDI